MCRDNDFYSFITIPNKISLECLRLGHLKPNKFITVSNISIYPIILYPIYCIVNFWRIFCLLVHSNDQRFEKNSWPLHGTVNLKTCILLKRHQVIQVAIIGEILAFESEKIGIKV